MHAEPHVRRMCVGVLRACVRAGNICTNLTTSFGVRLCSMAKGVHTPAQKIIYTYNMLICLFATALRRIIAIVCADTNVLYARKHGATVKMHCNEQVTRTTDKIICDKFNFMR